MTKSTPRKLTFIPILNPWFDACVPALCAVYSGYNGDLHIFCVDLLPLYHPESQCTHIIIVFALSAVNIAIIGEVALRALKYTLKLSRICTSVYARVMSFQYQHFLCTNVYFSLSFNDMYVRIYFRREGKDIFYL